ncbi:MAG: hypothetical protein JNK15_23925, partial [Planctomycetes bacterium]|nr:hypothetical protein [Planctomycetota bacterium]
AVLRWHNGASSTLGPADVCHVRHLAVDGNGDVWAGGTFASIGGVAANHLARWDGVLWHAVGWNGGEVKALHIHGGNDVYGVDEVLVGGTIQTRVRRQVGGAWSAFGPLLAGVAASLATRANGEVWLGLAFPPIGAEHGIVRGTGGAWLPAGAFRRAHYEPTNGVNHLRCLSSGEMLGGGAFVTVDDVGACGAAVHDGAAWHAVVSGTNEPVRRFVAGGPGEVFVAGWFRQIDGVAANHVARWHNGTFAALASGTDGPCDAILRRSNGDLVVGGSFSTAGGVAASRVAIWNGTAWAPLGAGLTGTVEVLAEFDGVLFAAGSGVAPIGGGSPGVCAFVGGGWLAVAPRPGNVTALLRRGNGELWLAGGAVPGPGGWAGVQRWNGAAWQDVTGLPSSMHGYCFTEAGNGDVYVGGFDNYQHPVWQWSGGTWTEVGSGLGGSISALHALPDGRLLAFGGATLGGPGGLSSACVAWDGVAWSPWGTSGTNGVATFLHDHRELWLAGPVSSWNGTFTGHFARVLADCPALVATYGSGCSVGGGANFAVQSEAAAWLGGSLRTVASGLATNAPAFGIYGTLPLAVPLAAVVPWATPGCSLLLQPFVLIPGTPTATGTAFAVAIPANPALVGLPLYHQALALVASGSGLAGVTSNGLHCTLGDW